MSLIPVKLSSAFKLRYLLLCLTLTLALTLSADAADADQGDQWSRFHGKDGIGYCPSGTIPDSWTDADYRWRYKTGARDVGSPVVAAGKVFLLASQPKTQKIAVEALDLASGKKQWSKQYDHPSHHLHRRNTFASSTPATDGENVFVAWSNPEHTYLKCFDHDGNELWSRDFGTWQSQHGFGTSPRIVGDKVLLFNSQQADQLKPGQVGGSSRMIAVDRKTGKTSWETGLKTRKSCYGVPAIYQPPQNPSGQRLQVIGANTGNGLFGLSIDTGKLLWSSEVFDARCCSTPLIVGDIAIGSAGSGGGGNHLVAVRIPANDSDKPKKLYRIDRNAPYVPTPVVKGKHLFMIGDKGVASCIDVQTGDSLWQKRIGGNFSASPIIIGDKMLIISLTGQATVLRASAKWEQISQFELGGSVGATPAFANGNLILRVGDELLCLGSDAI